MSKFDVKSLYSFTHLTVKDKNNFELIGQGATFQEEQAALHDRWERLKLEGWEMKSGSMGIYHVYNPKTQEQGVLGISVGDDPNMV